jgi:AcrR family transcriptional regulator
VTRSSTHEDQRRRILRAVGEVVGKRGYGEVTVERIVKRAHVSYKTFYNHFSGKEECYSVLFDEVVSSTKGLIRERLAAEPAPWPEQVAAALRTFIEAVVADPIIARAVIVEAPVVGPAILDRYEQSIRAFAPLFRAGRKLDPRGAELPPTIEDILAGSVFWSVYQRLMVGEAELLPGLLPDLIELVVHTYMGEDEAIRVARAEASRQRAAIE